MASQMVCQVRDNLQRYVAFLSRMPLNSLRIWGVKTLYPPSEATESAPQICAFTGKELAFTENDDGTASELGFPAKGQFEKMSGGRGRPPIRTRMPVGTALRRGPPKGTATTTVLPRGVSPVRFHDNSQRYVAVLKEQPRVSLKIRGGVHMHTPPREESGNALL